MAPGFGLAEVKKEGSAVPVDRSATPFDRTELEPETFWFEQAYTKDEYARMAVALEGVVEPLLCDMRGEFLRRAKNGYGGGS